MTKEEKEENIGKEFKRLLTYTFKNQINIRDRIEEEKILSDLKKISKELNIPLGHSNVLREWGGERHPNYSTIKVYDNILRPLLFPFGGEIFYGVKWDPQKEKKIAIKRTKDGEWEYYFD